MWIEYESPAKLNLCLHVVGRYPDGYHCIESVMVPISLCDTLSFQCEPLSTGSTRISLMVDKDLGVSSQDNLVYKAAQAVMTFAQPHVAWDIQIHLNKRIPTGAGLGGGSSNAATTLLALNTLCDLNLDVESLKNIAFKLGADVPFFIQAQPAFVKGKGECIEPIELSPCFAIIYQPKHAISTASIFQSPSLERSDQKLVFSQVCEHFKKHAHVLLGRNTLEKEVCFQLEVFKSFVETIHKIEPHVRMTGSGSCFFSLYQTRQEASKKLAQINHFLSEYPECHSFLKKLYLVDLMV